jgi:hypothetical protein
MRESIVVMLAALVVSLPGMAAQEADAGKRNAQAEQQGKPEKSSEGKEDAAKGGEHDGTSGVDMTSAKKRGPVGPIKDGPDRTKQ